MSDTPETDEASFDYDARAEYWVDAEFAKKLERERDALKERIAKFPEIGASYLCKDSNCEVLVTEVGITVLTEFLHKPWKTKDFRLIHVKKWDPSKFVKLEESK